MSSKSGSFAREFSGDSLIFLEKLLHQEVAELVRWQLDDMHCPHQKDTDQFHQLEILCDLPAETDEYRYYDSYMYHIELLRVTYVARSGGVTTQRNYM